MLDHLDDFVERHVISEDGQLLCGGGWRIGGPLYTQFYVCPRTGLLRENRQRRRRPRRKPPDVDHLVIDARRQYRQLGGLWYEVLLEPIAPEVATRRDIVLDCLVSTITPYQACATYGGQVFAAAKRQLNKREIRRAQALLADLRRRRQRSFK